MCLVTPTAALDSPMNSSKACVNFFKVPNNPTDPHIQIALTYKIVDMEVQKMPLRCQFLLTLMKLRQNLGHKDLAFRFQIPLQKVSIVLNSWVDYMYDRLGQLSIWPHRDVISQNMPASFKKDFSNTFAILDCTELKTEAQLLNGAESDLFHIQVCKHSQVSGCLWPTRCSYICACPRHWIDLRQRYL